MKDININHLKPNKMIRVINRVIFTGSLAGLLVAVGCQKHTNPTIPTVTTSSISSLSFNTATTGGTITGNGGAAVTNSGICWSKTNNSPSIGTDSFTTGTASTGSFVSVIANLVGNTPYYVRAYATNSAGTGYGNVVTFTTTIDTTKVSFMYNGQLVTYNVIVSPTTGRKWLDRNLGASRVATAANDSLAFGDLFQWGRLADGHQLRTSDTTSVLSTTDVPPNSKFIAAFYTNTLGDWRKPSNDNLWQGSHGINSPCPAGWHVPSNSEWIAETGIVDSASGFAQLKLVAQGGVRNTTGILAGGTAGGFYWTGTPITASASGANAYFYYITSTGSHSNGGTPRALGCRVRCIKD
jgi:hypothetical protein